LLRAYANGGSSLTGLEAISNGVASFRRPESPNARKTLVTMSCILAFLLLGITLLAAWTHALPYDAATPPSSAKRWATSSAATASGTSMKYIALLATIMILYTGGNTSFNGFPFLANYVATDKYLPRQFTKRGHRLAFSNGIIVLGIVPLTLIIVFNAKVNALVALYAIGVFTGFTMAGAGMVARHLRERTGKWRFGVGVNALSATGHLDRGAHLRVRQVQGGRVDHRGRRAVHVPGSHPLQQAVRARGAGLRVRERPRRDDEHPDEPRGGLRRHLRPRHRAIALLYCHAQRLFHPRRALRHRPARHQAFRGEVGRPNTASAGITLEIVECEDRRVDRAALELVADIVRDPEVFCMVILPRRGYVSRLQRFCTTAAPTRSPARSCTCRAPRRRSCPYRAVRKISEGDDARGSRE
jgi:hypothetical protein